MKYANLFDTDPLAMIALGGLAVTIVVSFGIFGFLLTRRNSRKTG